PRRGGRAHHRTRPVQGCAQVKGATMANDILVLADHLKGQLSDTTLELVAKAKELAGATGGQAVVALLGDASLAGQITGADAVLTMDHPALADYTPEAWEKALHHLCTE